MTTPNTPIAEALERDRIARGAEALERSARQRGAEPEALVVPLAEDERACLGCGVAVAIEEEDAPPIERMTSHVQVGPAAHHVGERDVEFTHCDDCAALRELAARVIDAHDSVRARIGSRSIAVDRVTAALLGLAAVGAAHTAPKLTRTPRDTARILRLLGVVGANARWASRFVPFADRGADPRTAAARPWAHLEGDDYAELRDALRTAYARLLRERTERPRAYACPTGGCALCGVGSIVALPTAEADGRVWREVGLGSLGGGRGHACPACWAAVERGGGVVGATAAERALLEHLGAGARAADLEFGTPVAWAAQRRRGAPNGAPWEHVDLDGLRRYLGIAR